MPSPGSDSAASSAIASRADTGAGELTLAELVAEVPGRARVFESLHFDYCCHGALTLAEACRQQDRSVDDVVRRLAGAPPKPPASPATPADHDDRDWRDEPIGELIDHIEDVHHAYLRRELPRLDELLAKVASHHGERDPRLMDLRSILHLLRAELEMHMIKEEQILFPFGRQLAAGVEADSQCGSVRNPVAAMMAEHDEAGSSLARMRYLTDGFQPPAEACATYRELLASLQALEADLHLHIHEENNILFPRLVACETAKNRTADN